MDQKKLRIWAFFTHCQRLSSYQNFHTFNPFEPSVAFHIEISYLIRSTNQITGLCVKIQSGLKLVDSDSTNQGQ